MKPSPVVHGNTEFLSENIPALKRKLSSLFVELEQAHATCARLQQALEYNHKAIQGLADVGLVEKSIMKGIAVDSKLYVANALSAIPLSKIKLAKTNPIRKESANSGHSVREQPNSASSSKAKSMQKIITSINLENSALLECVKELIREKTVAQSKGLLLEELVDLTESEYKAIMQALAKDRTELRFDRASLTKYKPSFIDKIIGVTNNNPSVVYTPGLSLKPNSAGGNDLRSASQYSMPGKGNMIIKKPGVPYSNLNNQLIDHPEDSGQPAKLKIGVYEASDFLSVKGAHLPPESVNNSVMGQNEPSALISLSPSKDVITIHKEVDQYKKIAEMHKTNPGN